MLFDKLFSRLQGVASPGFPPRQCNMSAPIAFMHIPKTSGSSLIVGLRQAIAPRKEIYCLDRVLFGGFRAFDTVAPSERNNIFIDPLTLPSDLDFVAGHIAFSTLKQRYPSANHLTLLREPMSRVLSHWLFWRAVPEEYLALLGSWADYMRRAHGSLTDFLTCREIACQVDNLSIRMLLWPHRLIPEDDFIDCRNGDALLSEAATALKQFAFVDVIENPNLQSNLEQWLGRPVPYSQLNETTHIPPPLQRPLHSEITPDAFNFLERRTQIDRELWRLVANNRVTGLSVEALRQHTMLRTVARHALLMHKLGPA